MSQTISKVLSGGKWLLPCGNGIPFGFLAYVVPLKQMQLTIESRNLNILHLLLYYRIV